MLFSSPAEKVCLSKPVYVIVILILKLELDHPGVPLKMREDGFPPSTQACFRIVSPTTFDKFVKCKYATTYFAFEEPPWCSFHMTLALDGTLKHKHNLLCLDIWMPKMLMNCLSYNLMRFIKADFQADPKFSYFI